ncbi:hypothetical protein NDU88_012535, partial [Pleurodeles waltl]
KEVPRPSFNSLVEDHNARLTWPDVLISFSIIFLGCGRSGQPVQDGRHLSLAGPRR